MDFTRTASTPINAALNYGYGILLSACNREIVANGYITQFALFHDNMFNPFNLGSDLMELFRVMIDGKQNYVSNALKLYCRSIFDAINEKDVSQIRFYRNEL